MEEIHSKIPHRQPFLFVDEIVEISESGAKTVLHVLPEMPFFKGHYPGKPIMPGVLLSEAVFQTGAVFLSSHLNGENILTNPSNTPVLSRIRDARFKRMVKPGDRLEISVFLLERTGKFFNLRGEVRVEGKVAMTVSFALALVEGD